MIAEPEEPEDLFALPIIEPLPSAFDIAAARRELDRAGGPLWENEPEERRAALAFDAAAARLRLREQLGEPTLAEMLDAFADPVREAGPGSFIEPEDRGTAVLSELGADRVRGRPDPARPHRGVGR